MALDYWPFYHSYTKKMEKLSDQEVGRVVRALTEYSQTGIAPELAGRDAVAFDFIADDIDRSKAAYEAKCAQNRLNRTTVDDRQRPLTTVDDRGRPSTTVDDRDKNKSEYKRKSEYESKEIIPPAPPGAPAREEPVDPELGKAMRFYMDRINAAPSPAILTDIQEALRQKLDADVVIHAMSIAVDERKTSWSYIRAILKRYAAEGLTTLALVQESEQRRERTGRRSRKDGGPYGKPDKRDDSAAIAQMDKLMKKMEGKSDVGG